MTTKQTIKDLRKELEDLRSQYRRDQRDQWSYIVGLTAEFQRKGLI